MYRLFVKTGDVTGAGTNSNVFLTIFGEKGETKEVSLTKMMGKNPLVVWDANSLGSYIGGVVANLATDSDIFERRNEDVVTFDLGGDIGKLEKLKFRSDGSDLASPWLLEWVKIRYQGRYYKANYGDWVKEGEPAEILLPEPYGRDYEVTFKTTDEINAGTDSVIKVKLVGTAGATSFLEPYDYFSYYEEGGNFVAAAINEAIKNNRFERGAVETATFTELKDIGKITRVEVSSNGKGSASDWHLSWVRVDGEYAIFNKLIKSGTHSANIGKAPKIYKLIIKTGGKSKGFLGIEGAGTDSNIFVIIYGADGETKETELNPRISGNAFEKNDTDRVNIEDIDVGKLSKIRVRSDGKWASSDWYLSYIQVNDNKATFNTWIGKGHRTRDLKPPPMKLGNFNMAPICNVL